MVVLARAAGLLPAGIYAIHSSANYFAALNGTNTAGTGVHILSGEPSSDQFFNFQLFGPSLPDAFTIQHTTSGLYLTAQSGAATTVEERNASEYAQLWAFKRHGKTESYHIFNGGVSGVVDAAQSDLEDWVVSDLILYMQEFPATFNQLWKFRPKKD